jgi:cell shape-determining protein MreD
MRFPDLPMQWLHPGKGNGMRFVIALGLLAVLFQVAFLWRLDIGPLEGTPNLVVALVVAVAAYRGVVVGAVFGFAVGLLVELFTPGETLGVLALAYVAIGAWCGRFASWDEPPGRVLGVVLVAVAATLVPIWFGVMGWLRGDGFPLGFLLRDVALAQLVFSLPMAFPAWGAAKRLLGSPREVEPWLVPA